MYQKNVNINNADKLRLQTKISKTINRNYYIKKALQPFTDLKNILLPTKNTEVKVRIVTTLDKTRRHKTKKPHVRNIKRFIF
jgi:hypothetical protein